MCGDSLTPEKRLVVKDPSEPKNAEVDVATEKLLSHRPTHGPLSDW